MRPLRALPASAPLADVVARRPAAFSYRELEALSTEGAVRAALNRGDIVRLLPDCYVAAEHADSFLARADAALTWAGPHSLLAGASALHLWGALERPPGRIDICVPHAQRPRGPSWIRARRISYEVETGNVGRMRTASAPFALAQGYADLPSAHRARAVYSLLNRRVTSTDEILDALACVPRVRERRALLGHVAAAAAGAESWLEEEGLTTVFAGREFSRFIRQHTVRCGDRRYRLDMYDPRTRTAVELDGASWHASPPQRERDLRRDADLAAVGIQTVRLTYRDIVERPEWCRRVVLQVLTAREQR